MKNEGIVPHDEHHNHLDDVKHIYLTIYGSIINNAMQLDWSSPMNEDDS